MQKKNIFSLYFRARVPSQTVKGTNLPLPAFDAGAHAVLSALFQLLYLRAQFADAPDTCQADVCTSTVGVFQLNRLKISMIYAFLSSL